MAMMVCQVCGGEMERTRGPQKYCTECRADAYQEQCKAYYRANREKIRQQRHEYQVTHRQQLAEAKKEYRSTSPVAKAYHETNLEKTREYARGWSARNRKCLSKKRRERRHKESNAQDFFQSLALAGEIVNQAK